MENVYKYYKENIEAYTKRIGSLKHKIHLMGSIRLALVAGACACLWLLRDEGWEVIMATLSAFIIPFGLLIWYHNRLSARKAYAEILVGLNENELKGLGYDFSAFDGAPDKTGGDHPFSLDLDLFGPHSLFQSINRTVTAFGREKLADWLTRPLTQKAAIEKRQEAVRELAASTALRQHFYVTGTSQPGERNDRERLDKLAHHTNVFLDNPVWRILTWAVPAIWAGLTIAYLMDMISGAALNLYLLLVIVVAYGRTRQVNALHATVGKMEAIFRTYSELLQSIEGDHFQSKEMREICGQLANDNEPASRAIKRFSSYIGGLDQRFSLAGIIFNILYLRDTRHAILLERWKQDYIDKLPLWFEALARFDALSSLAGFAFNHPGYVYPEIADTYFKMEGKALGHPLLNRDVCVRNSIDIPRSPWFLIITGANMAGKSTFLRTIGVNYLLACMGTPVCAESLTVYPAQLVTSLRTSDSLASNESYFFAELKRLKMIIDRLRQGEQLFIILDEILKGTNSVDKQKGSLALMKQLVANQACGIIATHDLVLGSLEQEFPDKIKNYRFEADIKDDELSFSYTLREGIAQNMNACFLMKKMGITVE